MTEDGRSQFERAVILQEWFREDGGFEYSLDARAPGNGPDQLELFLGTDEAAGPATASSSPRRWR